MIRVGACQGGEGLGRAGGQGEAAPGQGGGIASPVGVEEGDRVGVGQQRAQE
ncbi:MAG: hypothetical protein R3E79_23965 [Caldilineaceae bacterium]